jgi:hypothetical protein
MPVIIDTVYTRTLYRITKVMDNPFDHGFRGSEAKLNTPASVVFVVCASTLRFPASGINIMPRIGLFSYCC